MTVYLSPEQEKRLKESFSAGRPTSPAARPTKPANRPSRPAAHPTQSPKKTNHPTHTTLRPHVQTPLPHTEKELLTGTEAGEALKKGLKTAGRTLGTGAKTLGEDIKDAVEGKRLRKRGLIDRLKQGVLIGAAMASIGGVFKGAQTMRRHAEVREIVNNIRIMEDAYGWQATLPEDSPLWNVDKIENIGKLTGLTKQQAFLYSHYLQSFQSFFSRLGVGTGHGTGSWDNPQFTPDRDPLLHLKDVENLQNQWLQKAMFAASSSPEALASLQIVEKEINVWNKIVKDITSYQKPHERFKRGQELAQQIASKWVEAVEYQPEQKKTTIAVQKRDTASR